MPYKIVKTKKGFKVCKADLSKCFSKKPLSKDTAEKQMRAIYMNEKKKMEGGGIMDDATKVMLSSLFNAILKERHPTIAQYDTYISHINKILGFAGLPLIPTNLGRMSIIDYIRNNFPSYVEKTLLGSMEPYEKTDDYYNEDNEGAGCCSSKPKVEEPKPKRKKIVLPSEVELTQKNPIKKMKEHKKKFEPIFSPTSNPSIIDKIVDEDGGEIVTSQPLNRRLQEPTTELGDLAERALEGEGKKEGGCGFCCLMDGGAKPLTARLGGKVLLKKQIVKKFFPNPIDYNTYIEPFVGGGSVYFFKDKENHKEIVNDIDPNIYTIFKGFQKYGPEKIATEVNGDYTKKDFEKLLEFQPTNDFNKFIKTFLLNRLSYFSRGKTFGKPRIHSNFKGYQERLKDATILNEDYKKVISKYDGPNVFFYLDPPYKPSQTQYHYPAINLKELKKVVDGIKGKFLISIPDGNEVTKIFKDYNIFEIKTKYVGRRQQGGQTIPTRELLVSNYKPKMEGGATPLDKELYEKVKAEIYKKNKKHSLFRSAQIAKEYKKRGGKWIDDEKKQMNINRWFKQKWISLNDYYHNDAVVACGNSDTYEKFNEYPLCRPLALAKKLGKEKIGELIQKKEGPKPVRSEKVLGTDKYNIKSSLSGTGMGKFHKQLQKVGLTHDLYMKAVKHLAKSSGYDPKLVEMSDDGDHKLVYHSPEGLKRFGKVGYGDYIIWSAQEAKGKVPKGTAEQKRSRFRKSHGAMSKIHNLGKYSPNELAINLLW